MPLTSSAKKALRVDRRRKLENDLVRAKIKSALKSARISIATQAFDIEEKMKQAYKELDLAAKKNIIHDGKADRLKSRLAKALSKTKTAETPLKKTAKAKAVKKKK